MKNAEKHRHWVRNKRRSTLIGASALYLGQEPIGDQDNDDTLQIVGVIRSNTCAIDINNIFYHWILWIYM